MQLNEIFYHASNNGNLDELLPLSILHRSDEKVCYVTPIREYALFYLRDMAVNHVTCGVSSEGVVIYDEQFPNQLEKIYQGRSGYLYICESSDQVTVGHTKGVWVLRQPTKISKVEYVKDVYNEILNAEKHGRIEVNWYEFHSDERKAEITEMIKDYIITSNFLLSDSPKSRFFVENFPQAWELAKEHN